MPGRIGRANVAWEAMFRAQATLALEFEQAGDWGDLIGRQYGVLYALAGTPEGQRLTDLCDDVLLTQAGISRLVQRLEQRGLVERTPDPTDGRAALVRLTSAGAETQRLYGRRHAQHVADAMSRALDEDELDLLARLSRKLLAAAETESARRAADNRRNSIEDTSEVTTEEDPS